MPKFKIQDQVKSRSDESLLGVILEVLSEVGGIQYYKVRWSNTASTKKLPEDDILPLDEIFTLEDSFISSKFAGYDDFLREVTLQRLERKKPIKNTLYAFNASKTRFFPYQFKPLMKMLDSENYRILICDEVGLGKTIEAGLILTEFCARFESQRILITCPSSLTGKWQSEMRLRFDQDFRIYRRKELDEFFNRVKENDERSLFRGIVSIETLRYGNVISQIEELSLEFDMVIVDEAHHMRNRNTKQWKVGRLLSNRATAMIMLTATPVQIGMENLYNLLNILDEKEFMDTAEASRRFSINENIVLAQTCISQIPPKIDQAWGYLEKAREYDAVRRNPHINTAYHAIRKLDNDIKQNQDKNAAIKSQIEAQRALASLNLIGHIYTRTKRRDVNEKMTVRKACPINVSFKDHERRFYDAVTDYVRSACSEKNCIRGGEAFRLNMPQRQMASSIPAMVQHYKNNYNRIFDDIYYDIDDNTDYEQYDLSEKSGTMEENDPKPSYEQSLLRLRGIVDGWDESWVDSKYESMREAIEKAREKEGKVKVLIFSFFKGTIRYLKSRLEKDNIKSVMIDGSVPTEERGDIINRFREEPDIEVMLSSKVGAEGLDFQFCHIMINYDLPWNPMEVEQRIGRLDRIGQKSDKIYIYNFWIEDTIEERILKRLYDRIDIFNRSIGSLEPIIGEIGSELQFEILSKSQTQEEEEAALERQLIALENSKKDMEEIESDVSKFIGVDSFFDQEVERSSKSNLHITPGQLQLIVESFIEKNAPQTLLSYSQESHKGKLTIKKDFIRIMKGQGFEWSHIPKQEKSIDITFKGEVAYQCQETEFIGVIHPIVRSIVKFYSDNARQGKRTPQAHYICLETNTLPPGLYFFSLVLFEERRAVRDEHSLQLFIVNDSLDEIAIPDYSDKILGEILERGKNPSVPPDEYEPEDLKQVIEVLQEMELKRQGEIKKELQIFHEATLNRHRDTIESSFERIIKSKEDILKRELSKENPNEKIANMHRSTISNKRTEMEIKLKEIENRKTPSVNSAPISLGCLEIINLP